MSKDNKELVLQWFDDQDKHPALTRAIDVLSIDIYSGPCYRWPNGMCNAQTNIARFIEKHFDGDWITDLLFDDCGNILEKNGRPMTVDELYEDCREEEPEYSYYWDEVTDFPEEWEAETNRDYKHEDNGRRWIFNPESFYMAFSQYYDPNFPHITLVEASEVEKILLKHCTELVSI